MKKTTNELYYYAVVAHSLKKPSNMTQGIENNTNIINLTHCHSAVCVLTLMSTYEKERDTKAYLVVLIFWTFLPSLFTRIFFRMTNFGVELALMFISDLHQ